MDILNGQNHRGKAKIIYFIELKKKIYGRFEGLQVTADYLSKYLTYSYYENPGCFFQVLAFSKADFGSCFDCVTTYLLDMIPFLCVIVLR